jgi:hypothetical protein
MTCPTCACEHFYVRDSDDEYEMHEFDLQGGDEVVFTAEEAEEGKTEIRDETEIYCDNCSWHGKFKALKK